MDEYRRAWTSGVSMGMGKCWEVWERVGEYE